MPDLCFLCIVSSHKHFNTIKYTVVSASGDSTFKHAQHSFVYYHLQGFVSHMGDGELIFIQLKFPILAVCKL